MDSVFSVWLVPQEEKELSKIVKNLAQRYDSPAFIPHLTLLGGTTINFDNLRSTIDEVFEDERPFVIKKTKLNQSKLFFKTVFIEFELSDTLKKLFLELSKKTDKIGLENFKPHISLIYKLMPEDEKIRIIENLDVKNNFIVDSAYIVSPKKGDADFLDVEGWRVLYKKSLNS